MAAWTPFLANPAYPDYVSGANTLTGAVMEMLTLFFGTDEVNVSGKNPNPAVIRTRHTEAPRHRVLVPLFI